MKRSSYLLGCLILLLALVLCAGTAHGEAAVTDPWEALETAIGSAATGTEKDPTPITVSGTITAPADGSIIIKGKHIKLVATASATIQCGGAGPESLFVIPANSSLTLGANVTLDGGSTANIGCTHGLVKVSGGKLTMEAHSAIQNNKSGRGVWLEDKGSTFTMSGGVISGNNATSNTATKIKNENGRGGGVYVSDGTFEMSGGEISGNEATNNGGGVYVSASEKFNMTGGTISGNKATKSDDFSGNGGGVYVYDGTFTMSGGVISGNTATDGGGGVYMESSANGTFNMSGGTISGNIASDGGGVYVDGGTFNMSGGKISGNTATVATSGTGGGMYVRGGTFNMSGKSEITGNTAYFGGGVSVRSGTFTMSSTSAITSNTAANGGGVYVQYKTDTFTMKGGTITHNKATNNGGGVYVGGIFTMTAGTISGNEAADDYGGGGVYVGGGGTFTMQGTSAITRNSATSGYGGGVSVVTNTTTATFIMSNGTISGNTAKKDGGGVWVTGTFTMKDGTIEKNTATVNGGGVCVREGAFIMEGGKIANNAATLNGGGVWVGVLYKDNSSINMSGGEISGNTATNNGGGVYVSRGTFEMSAGKISGNTATATANGSGGGVFVYNGIFNMSGTSTITGNNAYHGGGVCVDTKGTFNVSGNATVTGNKKIDAKGAVNNVYLNTGKTITVTGVLNETASIGVTVADPGVGSAITGTISSNNATAANFTSDNAKYETELTDNTIKLKLAPLSKPTITGQPTGDTVTYGSAKSLSVVATQGTTNPGDVLNYQWYSNMTNSNTNGTVISGATAATYTQPATQAVGTYYYYCEVKATQTGHVDSDPTKSSVATVTVDKAIPTVSQLKCTVPTMNLIYDGNAKTATVVAADGVLGLGGITVKYKKGSETEYLTGAPTDAGTYSVYVNVADGTNYTAVNDLALNQAFTITKAAPTAALLTYTAPTSLT
ncbi:MAG: right-handed parallel beta-helix repeat-containing protein, partial [Clostridia bacterium]